MGGALLVVRRRGLLVRLKPPATTSAEKLTREINIRTGKNVSLFGRCFHVVRSICTVVHKQGANSGNFCAVKRKKESRNGKKGQAQSKQRQGLRVRL